MLSCVGWRLYELRCYCCSSRASGGRLAEMWAYFGWPDILVISRQQHCSRAVGGLEGTTPPVHSITCRRRLTPPRLPTRPWVTALQGCRGIQPNPRVARSYKRTGPVATSAKNKITFDGQQGTLFVFLTRYEWQRRLKLRLPPTGRCRSLTRTRAKVRTRRPDAAGQPIPTPPTPSPSSHA